MSFVSGITTDAYDRAIVESIIRLGDALDLGVIAEGIEILDHHRQVARTRVSPWTGLPHLATSVRRGLGTHVEGGRSVTESCWGPLNRSHEPAGS